jgi:anti-anti-sigma factor
MPQKGVELFILKCFIQCINKPLKLEIIILENGIKHAKLVGSMDLQGTNLIHHEFTIKLASSTAPVLIEMSEVSFIGSLGMRTLIMTAKAVHQRGGKTAILKPQALVREALVLAGFDKIMPIYDDFQDCCVALKAVAT